jgi:hypothetical protein
VGDATFSFDKSHLQDLKTKVANLSGDLTSNTGIATLQEWGTENLWGPSGWDLTGTGTGGGGGGGGGNGSATLMLLPGNTELFPAAKTLQDRGTAYATSVIEAVNWVHDVLTNLASNIDTTITKIDTAEHDNTLTVAQAAQDFQQTIGDLGGTPPTSTTTIPNIPA